MDDTFFKSIKDHLDYHNKRRDIALNQLDAGVKPYCVIRIGSQFKFKCFKCGGGVHATYRVSMPILLEYREDCVVMHLCHDCTPDNLKSTFDIPISSLIKNMFTKLKNMFTKKSK